MIETVDQRLCAWVETVLGAVEVSLDPPTDARKGRVVNLYLFALAENPPLRTGERPPLQLSLHYLVTTWSDEAEDAHRMLGELVFAAMENSEFEVGLEPVPGTIWMAFEVKPRPSFVLRAPLQRERPQPRPKLVRQPLVVQEKTIVSLQGTVLGPEDIPLFGAKAELTHLGVSTRTDANGQFHFPTVPAGSTELRITAKGQTHERRVELPLSDNEPLVIRFTTFE